MIADAWARLPTAVRVLVPGLLVSAVGLWLFVEILDEVIENEAFRPIDEPLIDWFSRHRTPGLQATLTAITHVFGPVILPIVIAVGCGVWGWRSRSWRDPALLTGAMVMSTLLSMLIKGLVERPRPEESLQVIPGLETSFSFPSGHTTGAATLLLVTAYLLWRRSRGRGPLIGWTIASALGVVIVALSRMYLGYHFFSDVLAGACLGLFTLGLVICVDRWLAQRGRRGTVTP